MSHADEEPTGSHDLARELLHLPLAQVVPSNANPRLNLEKEPFAELKRSVHQNGLLQPIVVRPVNGKYEIIGGHRRFAAVRELARENPNDKRFARVAAVVIEADDAVVPVLQLAENINRSDLSPIEVADAIARALDGGVSNETLAASLGWNRRQLNRYVQLHDAPPWLRELATEVKVSRRQHDARRNVVIDPLTELPVVEIERLPGLPFTYLFELVTLYNVLKEADVVMLEDKGGDQFKPQAERITRKLATKAAEEGWSTTRLREEIKRAKDPTPRNARATKDAPRAFSGTKTKGFMDYVRGAATTGAERVELAAQLVEAIKRMGFKNVVING